MSSSDCQIYTDGSCLKNPGGPSGWCFCVLKDGKKLIVCGGEESSTNNRMELTAVIEALEFVTDQECTIYTDSLLTLKCGERVWKRKRNLDLWKRFDSASQGRVLHWEWVKAHNGNKYNDLVDRLARSEAKSIKNKNLAV